MKKIKSFFARLVAVIMEIRQQQANRLIKRYKHL